MSRPVNARQTSVVGFANADTLEFTQDMVRNRESYIVIGDFVVKWRRMIMGGVCSAARPAVPAFGQSVVGCAALTTFYRKRGSDALRKLGRELVFLAWFESERTGMMLRIPPTRGVKGFHLTTLPCHTYGECVINDPL